MPSRKDGGGAGDAYPCIQLVAAITNMFTAMYGMITPRDDASGTAIACRCQLLRFSEGAKQQVATSAMHECCTTRHDTHYTTLISVGR